MSNIGVYHLTDRGCSYVCKQKYDLDYNCGAGLVSTMINNSCCICVREQNKYFLHIDLCCWTMLQQNMPLEGVRPLPRHQPSYLFLPINTKMTLILCTEHCIFVLVFVNTNTRMDLILCTEHCIFCSSIFKHPCFCVHKQKYKMLQAINVPGLQIFNSCHWAVWQSNMMGPNSGTSPTLAPTPN